MKSSRTSLSDERGLTLVEMLAGLVLFGLVLSMLYGVLMSGYSLKDKVTRQATLNNFADLLVNEIMLSLKNTDEVTDVSGKFPGSRGALWTAQYENRGTKQQKRIYTLYLITDEGVPAGVDENGNPVSHYKLIRETYELPRGRTFLELEETRRFRVDGVAASEVIQLNDDRFPLLQSSAFAIYYDQEFDRQDVIGLTLTICRYDPEKSVQTDSAPFTFRSQININ